MDVSCPQCDTVFELEASQLSSGNATLQCSECEHVFRIRSEVENTKRWMLRNQAGDISYFSTFDVLHQWMMEQKVSKFDEVSRSGNKWVTLDSIGEFAPVFQVLESIKDLLPKSPDKDPVLEIPPEIRTQKPSRPRVQTEQQFVNFAEIEQTRDIDVEDDEDDDFIFGKNEAPAPAPVPRPEATASIRLPKGVDSTSSLELPWEMSQEVGIPAKAPQNKKSSGILKPLFLLLFLGCFVAGIAYLVNMKRETPTISLGTEKPVPPSENMKEANTLFHGAITKAESSIVREDTDLWDKRFAEAKMPVMEAIVKATSRAKKKGGTGNVESMLERGMKALESGNLSLARGSFIHVLDAQPGNSEAVTGLGWVKLETGDASGAVRQFRRALSLNSNYGQAYMGLGQALRESGQTKAALDAYTRYLKRFPRGSRAGIARYQQVELSLKLGLDKKFEKVVEENEETPVKKDIAVPDKIEKTPETPKPETKELPKKKDETPLSKKDDTKPPN